MSDLNIDVTNLLSFTVSVGAFRDLRSLIDELKERGYFVDWSIQQLVTLGEGVMPATDGSQAVMPEADPPVEFATEEQEIMLIAPRLKQLHFSKYSDYESIIDRGKEVGLKQVSAEQAMLARFELQTDERVIGTHQPIDISPFGASHEQPMTIVLADTDSGKTLKGEDLLVCQQFHPERRFLFSL